MDLEIERSRESLATSQQLGDVRQQLADVRFELKSEIAALSAKIEAVKSEVLRWMFLALTGQTALLIGLMRLWTPHG